MNIDVVNVLNILHNFVFNAAIIDLQKKTNKNQFKNSYISAQSTVPEQYQPLRYRQIQILLNRIHTTHR